MNKQASARLSILNRNILVVTGCIQLEFPELYLLLDETPLFMPPGENDLRPGYFERYLQTISGQLAAFQKAHEDI